MLDRCKSADFESALSLKKLVSLSDALSSDLPPRAQALVAWARIITLKTEMMRLEELRVRSACLMGGYRINYLNGQFPV